MKQSVIAGLLLVVLVCVQLASSASPWRHDRHRNRYSGWHGDRKWDNRHGRDHSHGEHHWSHSPHERRHEHDHHWNNAPVHEYNYRGHHWDHHGWDGLRSRADWSSESPHENEHVEDHGGERYSNRVTYLTHNKRETGHQDVEEHRRHNINDGNAHWDESELINDQVNHGHQREHVKRDVDHGSEQGNKGHQTVHVSSAGWNKAETHHDVDGKRAEKDAAAIKMEHSRQDVPPSKDNGYEEHEKSSVVWVRDRQLETFPKESEKPHDHKVRRKPVVPVVEKKRVYRVPVKESYPHSENVNYQHEEVAEMRRQREGALIRQIWLYVQELQALREEDEHEKSGTTDWDHSASQPTVHVRSQDNDEEPESDQLSGRMFDDDDDEGPSYITQKQSRRTVNQQQNHKEEVSNTVYNKTPKEDGGFEEDKKRTVINHAWNNKLNEVDEDDVIEKGFANIGENGEKDWFTTIAETHHNTRDEEEDKTFNKLVESLNTKLRPPRSSGNNPTRLIQHKEVHNERKHDNNKKHQETLDKVMKGFKQMHYDDDRQLVNQAEEHFNSNIEKHKSSRENLDNFEDILTSLTPMKNHGLKKEVSRHGETQHNLRREDKEKGDTTREIWSHALAGPRKGEKTQQNWSNSKVDNLDENVVEDDYGVELMSLLHGNKDKVSGRDGEKKGKPPIKTIRNTIHKRKENTNRQVDEQNQKSNRKESFNADKNGEMSVTKIFEDMFQDNKQTKEQKNLDTLIWSNEVTHDGIGDGKEGPLSQTDYSQKKFEKLNQDIQEKEDKNYDAKEVELHQHGDEKPQVVRKNRKHSTDQNVKNTHLDQNVQEDMKSTISKWLEDAGWN